MTRAEIQALIDAAPDAKIGIDQAGCPVVTIPYGQHLLDGPIVVNRRMDVDFQGGVLVPMDGVIALDVQAPAWGCRIRNINVYGQSRDPAAHDESGIVMGAYACVLEHVLVRWCGTGITWDGRIGEADDANDTWLDNVNGATGNIVRVFNCGTGVVVKGGDSNGGVQFAVIVDNCDVGIRDESFLGNTWVGLHMHTISGEGYDATASANYSTMLGSYMEADVLGGVDSMAKTTWVGGGAIPYVKVGDRIGLGMCRLGFSDETPDGGRITVRMPHAAVYAGATFERRDASDGLVNGSSCFRWIDSLGQCGQTWYGGGIANDGLTRPYGVTTVDGLTRVDAQHFTVGNPSGFAHE